MVQLSTSNAPMDTLHQEQTQCHAWNVLQATSAILRLKHHVRLQPLAMLVQNHAPNVPEGFLAME